MDANGMVDPTTINVGDLCGKVKAIEKRIEEVEARHKTELAPLNDLANECRGMIMQFLQATGQQNAKTPQGTAYLAKKESIKVEDTTTFQRHVIGTESWELIDWRANKTGVRAFETKHQELPPGLSKSVLIECRVLAPEKPRIKTITQAAVEVEPAKPTGFD
jgi:hypothetical protein